MLLDDSESVTTSASAAVLINRAPSLLEFCILLLRSRSLINQPLRSVLRLKKVHIKMDFDNVTKVQHDE